MNLTKIRGSSALRAIAFWDTCVLEHEDFNSVLNSVSNIVVLLLGWWRHGTTQDVCLWLVFPTAAASCLKQTIFVSQCNYHHLVILTMLTVSAFAKPLNVDAVFVWQLPQLSSSSCLDFNQMEMMGKEKIVFPHCFPFILNLTGFFFLYNISPCPLITFSTYWLLSDRHSFTWSHASILFSLGLQQVCMHVDYKVRAVG